MKKALLSICFAAAMAAMPSDASAFSYYLPEAPDAFADQVEQNDEREAPDMLQPSIQPVNGQNAVNVTGAQGQQLEVVSLTGKRVATIRIDSPAQHVELNLPKGCYILKVGKTARKVSVK